MCFSKILIGLRKDLGAPPALATDIRSVDIFGPDIMRGRILTTWSLLILFHSISEAIQVAEMKTPALLTDIRKVSLLFLITNIMEFHGNTQWKRNQFVEEIVLSAPRWLLCRTLYGCGCAATSPNYSHTESCRVACGISFSFDLAHAVFKSFVGRSLIPSIKFRW